MTKHVTNENGPNLVKYTVHKIGPEDKDNSKRLKCKNKTFITLTSIINFFEGLKCYKKSNPIQMGFIEDIIFMIIKGYKPLSIMESLWLRQMILCLYGQV
jgi:hypothetical protein